MLMVVWCWIGKKWFVFLLRMKLYKEWKWIMKRYWKVFMLYLICICNLFYFCWIRIILLNWFLCFVLSYWKIVMGYLCWIWWWKKIVVFIRIIIYICMVMRMYGMIKRCIKGIFFVVWFLCKYFVVIVNL